MNADGVEIPLRREAILRARDRARSSRRPHNVARKLFVTELLTELARSEAKVLNRPLDEEDLPRRARPPLGHRRRQRGTGRFLAAAHPGNAALRPARVAASDQSAAGFVLDHPERERLTRTAHPSRWTVADVPLLDEAAELLGVDDSAQKAARRAAERARRADPGVRAGGHRLGRRPGHGVLHDGWPARHARRRAALRLEHHGRRCVLHRGARRGRPDLGLRPRDHRRGAGAVGDGMADGAAPQPGPLNDRGRRRGANRLARRGDLLEGDAQPAGRPPLARGAPHGQLPHPGGDHGGRGGGTGHGRPTSSRRSRSAPRASAHG